MMKCRCKVGLAVAESADTDSGCTGRRYTHQRVARQASARIAGIPHEEGRAG
jgi:hypothetical protein